MTNSKSLVIDTTFILPIFGIRIDIFKDLESKLKLLWNNKIKGYDIYLPSICLVETIYKLLNEYKKYNDYKILDRYQKILPTVLNLPIKIFNCELNPKASMIASIIRHSGHPDFMDGWIAGTAVSLNGILLSEDIELKKKLMEIPETKNLILLSWNELLKKI